MSADGKMNKVEARFTLWGTFDPDDLSRKIGIQATSTSRKGDSMSPSDEYDDDVWRSVVEEHDVYDISDVIYALRNKLENHTDCIHKTCTCLDCEAILKIFIYKNSGTIPMLYVDTMHMNWLLKMNCDLDIDIIY